MKRAEGHDVFRSGGDPANRPGYGLIVSRDVAKKLLSESHALFWGFLPPAFLELLDAVLHGMRAVGQATVVGDLNVEARARVEAACRADSSGLICIGITCVGSITGFGIKIDDDPGVCPYLKVGPSCSPVP